MPKILQRPWRRTSVLIKGVPVRNVGQLDGTCGARLAEHLHALARWDPEECGSRWVVSDTTCLIVSFAISPHVEAYVQFLTGFASGRGHVFSTWP